MKNTVEFKNTIVMNGATFEVSKELYDKIKKTMSAKCNQDQLRFVKPEEVKSEAPKQDSKKSTTQNTKTKNTKNTGSSKSTTSTKNTKPVAKKSDDDEFDYTEYIRIAKELDVIRLDGKPWKSMRTTIYAVMNGEMTMKQAEAAKAKVAKKFEKK